VTDGVARMREMEGGLDIPAGQSVALNPGGKHIMLMGLTGPLVEGAEITLTLTFEKAGAIEVSAPVVKVIPSANLFDEMMMETHGKHDHEHDHSGHDHTQ